MMYKYINTTKNLTFGYRIVTGVKTGHQMTLVLALALTLIATTTFVGEVSLLHSLTSLQF